MATSVSASSCTGGGPRGEPLNREPGPTEDAGSSTKNALPPDRVKISSTGPGSGGTERMPADRRTTSARSGFGSRTMPAATVGGPDREVGAVPQRLRPGKRSS